MAFLLTTALPLAERYWRGDHMDGDWWPMALVMAIFVAVVVVLLVWLVRSGGIARGDSAEEILKRRLADGSINVEEYESRRAALKQDG